MPPTALFFAANSSNQRAELRSGWLRSNHRRSTDVPFIDHQSERLFLDVAVEIIRNETRRLRIGKIDVALRTKLPSDHPALAACLRSFEDFCLVTQSVRQGIDVAVHVESEAKPSS